VWLSAWAINVLGGTKVKPGTVGDCSPGLGRRQIKFGSLVGVNARDSGAR
jgi:hypothetical protein